MFAGARVHGGGGRVAGPRVGRDGRQPLQRITPYGVSALLAAAVLGVVALSMWSPAPDAPRQLEPEPSPVTGWEAVLRSHLPPRIAVTCTRQDDPPHAAGEALVSLVCAPGLPVLRVQYSVLPDVAALRARHRADVQPPGGRRDSAGVRSCEVIGGAAAGTWWMAPLQHAPEDARRHLGEPPAGAVTSRGGFACGWAAGTATLTWYDEDTLIYAWATTTPGLAADLVAWWRRGASGPWHPAVGAGPYREVSAHEEAR